MKEPKNMQRCFKAGLKVEVGTTFLPKVTRSIFIKLSQIARTKGWFFVYLVNLSQLTRIWWTGVNLRKVKALFLTCEVR